MPFVSGTGNPTSYLGAWQYAGPEVAGPWPIVRADASDGLAAGTLKTAASTWQWGATSGTSGAGTAGVWDYGTGLGSDLDNGDYNWKGDWSDGTDLYILHLDRSGSPNHWVLRVTKHPEGGSPTTVAGPFTSANWSTTGDPNGPYWLTRRSDGSFVALVNTLQNIGGTNRGRAHLVVWNAAGTSATEYDVWSGSTLPGTPNAHASSETVGWLDVQPTTDLLHIVWSDGAATYHRTLDTGGTWGAFDGTVGVSGKIVVGQGVPCVRSGTACLAVPLLGATLDVAYLAADAVSTAALATEAVPQAVGHTHAGSRATAPLAVTGTARDADTLALVYKDITGNNLYAALRDAGTGWPTSTLFKGSFGITLGRPSARYVPQAQNVGVAFALNAGYPTGGRRFDYLSTTALASPARGYSFAVLVG